MQELLSYLIPGIMTGAVYALIALGFVFIYKCSGVFNFAQGHLVVIGAYIFYAFGAQIGLPLWLGLLSTILAAAVLGLLIERFALRPVIGQPFLSIVMITMAIGGILEGIMMLAWGPDTLSIPRLFPIGGVKLAGISISWEHLFFLAVSLILIGIMTIFFQRTRLGLGMMASADDQQAAQSVGIKVSTVVAMSWVIACLVAAVGGILLTSITGVHYSALGVGLRAIAVVLLGGLESIIGVIVAGPVVGAIESVSAGYIDPLVGGGFRDIAAFLVMLIVLIFRPFGFFGWKRIERV